MRPVPRRAARSSRPAFDDHQVGAPANSKHAPNSSWPDRKSTGFEPGRDIGLESHPDGDQFLRVEAGMARVQIGPSGTDALRTGRRERVADDDAQIDRATTVPMYELRRRFTIALAKIESLERGATDVNLDSIREAARSIATAEDDIVLNGVDDTSTRGLDAASVHDSLEGTEGAQTRHRPPCSTT